MFGLTNRIARTRAAEIVNESVQVATRRTRTAGKVEIPNVDDHVSKLEHMGKETVKKLQDIHTAAIQAGVEIAVPDNCILKGGPPQFYSTLIALYSQKAFLVSQIPLFLKSSLQEMKVPEGDVPRNVTVTFESILRSYFQD